MKVIHFFLFFAFIFLISHWGNFFMFLCQISSNHIEGLRGVETLSRYPLFVGLDLTASVISLFELTSHQRGVTT